MLNRRVTHPDLGRQQKQALRQSGFSRNCAEMLIPTMSGKESAGTARVKAARIMVQ
jgi:hypothetical protein